VIPSRNQRLEAIPNVLRNQTIPNRLGGRSADPVQVSRLAIPSRSAIAIALATGLVVFLGLLVGRA
jgi:hypothetical protein